MSSSRNRRYRNRLMVTTAMAGATLLGLGQGAYAACAPTVAPNYVCSGANTTGQIVPDTITFPLDAGDALALLALPANPAVTTAPGFSVTTSDAFALGILGSGAVSYTDANASALTSTTGVGLGVASLVPVLQLTPPYFSPGPNPGGVVAIDTNGALTGALIGLAAINTGDGATTVTATGAIAATGNNGYGVVVYSQGSAATVTTGKVTGTSSGITAMNQGLTANLSVTANGDVTGGTGTGIFASNGGQQLDVVNTIANGTVTFLPGAPANAGHDLTITANGTVSGGDNGIFALNSGIGATSITATGAVSGTTNYGILAVNGKVTFNPDGSVATVTGSAGTDLTIKAASVTGGQSGIFAQNNGTGATSITTTGNAIGTAQESGGIYAINGAGATDLTVTANTASGGYAGIAVQNKGTGATSVTATGSVTSTTGDGYGIGAVNNSTASDLTVTANTVSGGYFGVYALNSGTGATSITATGAVSGTTNYGILAVNGKVTFNPDGSVATVTGSAGTDLTIKAASVTGGQSGIFAQNNGTGAISITTTGNAIGTAQESGGIYAINGADATDLTVTANTASGGYAGIAVQNKGTGATSVTATGSVTSTTGDGYGIGAVNNSTASDLTVTANTVSGGYFGVYALNSGSGATSITATGAVSGTTNYGILAVNGKVTFNPDGSVATVTGSAGTDLTIKAASVTGGQSGIFAQNTGTGATTITTTGTVEGGTSAISALSSAGHAITITTNGLVRNSSQLSSDLAVETSGGPVTFTNSGGLIGTVKLGIAANVVANKATWNTAGGSNDFGGGTLNNDAGKDIVAANVGSAAPVTTTFDALTNFTNNGRLTMANGIAGDVTSQLGGNATFAAGAVLAVDIIGAGQADLFHTSGTATIIGSTLDLSAQGLSTGHFVVLTADTGLIGQFATVTGITSTAFLTVTEGYDTHDAYLDVTKVRDFADAGLTPNQIATGGGLDTIPTSGALFSAVASLATDAEARAAFDQISGEIHASAKGMLVEDSRFVRDAATNRIASAFGDGSTAALPVMAYGEGGSEMVAADTDRFAVWGQAFGSWGNTDSNGNAAAFDRSTGGLLAGADTLVGGWRIGLLGGYSHSNFNSDDRNSSGKSDTYHLGLYGGTNWGAIAFRTGAAYSWSSLSTMRSVAFNGFADGLSADYDARTAQVFGEFAYKVETSSAFKFEPFANLAYVSVHTDGFTEQGGPAVLTSAGSITDATFTTLGLRGSTDFALGGINATARGMLGWRHAFGDVTPTSSFTFASGNAFTIAGVPIARNSAVIEAGLDFAMSANAKLGLSYSGQFGSGGVDNGAKVDLSVKF